MRARNVLELVCQEVVELITEYLSRAMTADERVRMEQHLLACPPCTAHLAQVRATLELARGLRQLPPEAGPQADDLVGLFRRWSRR